MIKKILNMNDINPYDGTHFENPADWLPGDYFRHREGIEFIKQEILNDKTTLPIAVIERTDRKYQRLDGYKRYMAHKELGDTLICCYVYDVTDGDIVTPGMQQGKGFIDMTVYVCKCCGRAIKAEEKPNYCYFDRMTSIENVSNDDAIKMGLFSLSSGNPCIFDSKLFTVEFIKDVRFTPITGKEVGCEMAPFSDIKDGYSLDDFQRFALRNLKED